MPFVHKQDRFDSRAAAADSVGVSRFAALRTLVLPVLLSLCWSSGCSTARDPALALVRVQASRDLDCPSKQLEVDSSWGGRYPVTGCARAATYDSACSGLECSVSKQGESPTPWMGRPDPHSPLGDR